MTAIERFCTSGMQPHEQLKYWNALCETTLARTSVDSTASGFRAEMLRWSFGDLTMLRPRSDSSVVHRAPAERGDDDTLVLHVQHYGQSRFTQSQRIASLETGDLVLASAHPGYHFALSQNHELLVVAMPRAPLEERIYDLEQYLCRSIGNTLFVRLLNDFILSLWRQGTVTIEENGWSEQVSKVLYDLLAAALTNDSKAMQPDGSQSSLLLKQAQAFIDKHLMESGINTSGIADALGVSVRTVQTIFARLATTPSGYILERRLLHAADRLRSDHKKSITEIAFDLGFNDSAYFSRCFRQRFGMSPREWRSKSPVPGRQAPAVHLAGQGGTKSRQDMLKAGHGLN